MTKSIDKPKNETHLAERIVVIANVAGRRDTGGKGKGFLTCGATGGGRRGGRRGGGFLATGQTELMDITTVLCQYLLKFVTIATITQIP